MSKYDFYSLDNLCLTIRPYRALRQYGIYNIQQLIDLYKSDKNRLMQICNIGAESFKEIERTIQNFLEKEGIHDNDNSLTEAEQQLYDELTTLINQGRYPGFADEIIEKLDELVSKLLEDKNA